MDNLPERISLFESDLKELRLKHNVSIEAVIDFPIYKQLPTEVQLAMEVIRKHGGVFVLSYKDAATDTKE